MKNKLILLLIISAITIGKVSSQSLFPEKYEGCITDRFTLESDTTTAKIDSEELMEIIASGLTEKLRNKIRGQLTLQIIVDLDGNSCLLSVKNDTNIKTKKLDLEKIIDSNLVWNKPAEKVAAIVLLSLTREEIKLKRVEMNAN